MQKFWGRSNLVRTSCPHPTMLRSGIRPVEPLQPSSEIRLDSNAIEKADWDDRKICQNSVRRLQILPELLSGLNR